MLTNLFQKHVGMTYDLVLTPATDLPKHIYNSGEPSWNRR
jgi:hypothetical protein